MAEDLTQEERGQLTAILERVGAMPILEYLVSLTSCDDLLDAVEGMQDTDGSAG